jgi:HK97 gp10 family phage protein
MNVTGLDVWTAKLVAAAVTVKPRVESEIETVAENITETMRSLAPVDTGALVDSIDYEVSGGTAEIGPTVSYAYFVEYGTVDTPPQPYAGPAADQHADDFVGRVAEVGGDI